MSREVITGECGWARSRMGGVEMRIVRIATALGAVVEGVSLRELDAERFEAVRAALEEHQVLFFRDQHLSDDEHLALASRWGRPMPHPVGRLLGHDQVVGWVRDTPDSPPDADGWHTDITYWPKPPKVAVLCAVELPATGGDTLWSSLYAAYDALSPHLQRLCEGLVALHAPSEKFVRAFSLHHGTDYAQVVEEHLRGALLPLVRTHDETGRQALFYSGGMVLPDLAPDESEILVRHFHQLVGDPNRTVRWRWQAGDVAIWDERCTNHRALSDHFPQFRLMRRCTVEGDAPFYRAAGASSPGFVARSVDAPLAAV